MAQGFCMQLTDDTWAWLWEIRVLFAMLTYHKDTPIAAAMAELARRRGGRKRISAMVESVHGAVVQQSLEMLKEGAAAKKARMADGVGPAAVDDAEMEAPPGDDEDM